MARLDPAQVEVGLELPPVSKFITQEKINKYAEASGDFNPLHIDPEFAKTTMYKGTIAHGLMSVAFLSEMMSRWAGSVWMAGPSQMEVAFLAPVRPGDTVTAKGKVTDKSVEDGKVRFTCEIWCENQEGQKVIAGKSQVVV